MLGQQLITVVDCDEERTEALFDQIMFPLVEELLKPLVFARDPRGMPETRLRASTLLCKLFMQYVINDARKDKEILPFWTRILDLLDRLMNANKRDQLVSVLPTAW